MNKQIIVYLYAGKLLSYKKEQTTETWNNLDICVLETWWIKKKIPKSEFVWNSSKGKIHL